MDDRVVHHLPVHLHRGGAFGLGLAERGDDALGARNLVRARREQLVGHRHLVGVHAQASLEAAAAAALQRAAKTFHVAQVEPRAVERSFHAGGTRGEHHARARLGKLRLFVRGHAAPRRGCSPLRRRPRASRARVRGRAAGSSLAGCGPRAPRPPRSPPSGSGRSSPRRCRARARAPPCSQSMACRSAALSTFGSTTPSTLSWMVSTRSW